MNDDNLIKLGALAQRHYKMKKDFSIHFVYNDYKPIQVAPTTIISLLIKLRLWKKQDSIVLEKFAFLETSTLPEKGFSKDEQADLFRKCVYIRMGYARKANMLCIRRMSNKGEQNDC